MQVLALNAGSSSLKFRLFDVDAGSARLVDEHSADAATRARGGVSGFGSAAVLELVDARGAQRLRAEAGDAAAACAWILAALREREHLRADAPLVTGHRIVHGGNRFRDPVRIDTALLRELRALSTLAPLHNQAACTVLETSIEQLGAHVPAVAVFDTAFHAHMPARAAGYAIPWELAAKHDIRRFGFHGLAHEWMWECWSRIGRTAAAPARIVTLQLGHGCSAAAVRDGISLDVTMGFTPLEGLMMGTRAGDVDAGLVPYCAERERTDAQGVIDMLNTRSGLLGVSGASADVRELLRLEAAGDARAALALDMFCYRIQKAIGAMQAALGGLDAIVFSGGIGENSAAVRARTAGALGWCGVELDARLNAGVERGNRRISSASSRAAAWVIPAEEEVLIARAALALTR